MNPSYDVAIIGAGAMGSAATYHLSQTGQKILVLDKFIPPHAHGSSHGQSRIIREAYFESPAYVPLVQQSYLLWNELEKASAKKLFLKTGGLMLGNKDQKVFQGAALSAKQYGIEYDFLDAIKIKNQFPTLQPDKDTVALLEKKAGILFPEECIRTQLQLSQKPNVDFHFNETVVELKCHKEQVTIITNQSNYTARKVIVSNGAWITSLLPELNLPLKVKRQVLFWFKCMDKNAEKFLPENFPVFIWEYALNKMFYGFPDLGDGIKIAIHHQGELTTANTINRNVTAAELQEITSLANRYFHANLIYNYAAVCMYTNTPDENFIIDFHPDHKNIIIVSACSGHGFKFSSAIGKILCEMVMEEKLSFDIKMFELMRKYEVSSE
ncbi:MAG: N-methyl-L-tryptophan oxidase [Chitinophagales bacterium]